ncbi:sunset domain-containing protein, partial [Saccharothrix hoggarensis]
PPPAAARPVRPRPVGFSPSTGGRPAPGTTRYQGQQEGFNPRSPFGPGSVLPKSDGKAPAPEFQVKATLTGRRYFTNESANFRETRADVWFRTTADAEKAGFRQAP